MALQRRILLLRHREAAVRTAANLHKLGYLSKIMSLSSIRRLSPPRPREIFDGIILTSPVAVQTLQHMTTADALTKLPTYCVGRYTAERAQAADFTNISAVEKDAASLAGYLGKHNPQQLLLYPCARNRSFDFDAHLASYDIKCKNWEIYSNELISPDRLQLANALGSTDIIFLFSERTALHFFKMANQDDFAQSGQNHHTFIAISPQVGRTVPRKFLANTYIANEKNESGMIDCLSAIGSDV